MRECEISWTNNYVSATGNSGDQKSNQSRLGFVQQIQTRADVKIVFPTPQTALIQHGDHADAELRLWHLDTIKGTRKNDTIDSTKNASPHHRDKQENTKRKLRPAKTRMMEKMKKQTTEAQMMEKQSVAVQTQIATKTVTSPS